MKSSGSDISMKSPEWPEAITYSGVKRFVSIFDRDGLMRVKHEVTISVRIL